MTRSPAHVAQGTPPAGTVRAERDRFVAFAFCAADVLLELDSRLTVAYAGGATKALTGRSAETLTGGSVFDIVPHYQRDMLRDLLEHAADEGARVEHAGMRLCGPDGPSVPLTLVGYYLPDLGGRYFLSLRMGAPAPAGTADEDVNRDPESGLLDVESFGEASEARLSEARARGEKVLMTVIDLDGMESLRSRLDAESRNALVSTLGDCLRANSVDGDSAGRFSADRYGLLHGPDLDVEGLRKRVADISREADPAGTGVTAKQATVTFDPRGLSPPDAAKALVYAIKKLDRDEDGSFTIDRLSDMLRTEIGETARRIEETQAIIEKKSFEVAFQPIVELDTRRIHHFEALARFTHNDPPISPFEFIRFAEEIGVVSEFDLAMCERVIKWLKHVGEAGKDFCVAVNLSARSVRSQEFVTKLIQLVKENQEVADHLLFELTESANIPDLERMNRVLQSLRKLSCQVCLDDFGAGESAFHYLRVLEVDFVKIDGSYVRDALTVTKDRQFLVSIAGLCSSLGIATIAEMIEDEETIKLVRKCGIQFGQGYFFGRPSFDITVFDAKRSDDVSSDLRRKAQA
ncbi:MAG: EAL domain-containing protein [Alphaproteobacteria bacterium]